MGGGIFDRRTCNCRDIDRYDRVNSHLRFGFLRPVQLETTLNEVRRANRRKNGRVEKLYYLRRSSKERFINDYNGLLLYIWRSNVDVQFIGEITMVINRYITKYTTKGEKARTAELWNAVNKSKSSHGQLLSLALRLFRSREVGHYEACDKVSGHPLHKSNVKIDFLNTNKKGMRQRRL
uniref:Uncharacterized protein n=1 Tax=Plectus sambesii TaxID=2011161 RepID=A0A914UMV4_9BILA